MRTTLRAVPRGVHASLLALLIGGTVGCNEKSADGTSSLAVIVSSDLAIPKDASRLSIEVTRGGQTLFSETRDIGPDALALPATFRISASADDTPAKITTVLFQGANPRIERTAVTPIPRDRFGALHLALNYLCDSTAQYAPGSTTVVSTCPDEQTCIQGQCTSRSVAPADIVDYQSLLGASGDASVGSGLGGDCFDVLGCFAAAQPATVDVSTCSVAAPEGSRLNVALKLPLGSVGTCDGTACWLVLDQGSGWSRSDSRITLPAAICGRLGPNASISVSTTCSAKNPLTPACSIGNPPSTNPNDASVTLPREIGDACQGAASMRCGNCGVQTRTCRNGQWTLWSACTAEGACAPNANETCADGTVRTCTNQCQWSTCGQSPVCPGEAVRQCGRCGTQRRECREGNWTDWQPCTDEKECAAGTTELCSEGSSRFCTGTCTWDGPCKTTPTCPGEASELCGNCGTRTRVCTDGQWGPWSACSDTNNCKPGQAQGCDDGRSQVCGGDCHWGTCELPVCVGDAVEACGRCGKRSRNCNPGNVWSNWSDCYGSGVCDPGATQSCGKNGTQSCSATTCQWGPCTCEGPSSQSCGQCGVQIRRCVEGSWNVWEQCTGQHGTCQPPQARPCGQGGVQACGTNCEWATECVIPNRNLWAWSPSAGPAYTVGETEVTDRTTQLVWRRTGTAEQLSWSEAATYCAGLSRDPLVQWRVPTMVELYSLMDVNSYWPSIDGNAFPDVDYQEDTFYISQTPGDDGNMGVSFMWGGDVSPFVSRGFVRCVRDASGRPLPKASFSRVNAEVIRDEVTGLLWQAGATPEEMDEAQASDYCARATIGGIATGWRLPEIWQLLTISDVATQTGTASPLFTGSTRLWSSTVGQTSGRRSWRLERGRPASTWDETPTTRGVRCVHPPMSTTASSGPLPR